jgi:hypothetical protein
MRATTRLVIAGIALTLAACRGPATFPSQKAGLRWTHRAHGVQHSTQREHVTLPFVLDPEGTSGTATLLAYLRALEQQGARFVSDVSIAIQLRHNGVPIECVSQILVEAGTAPPAPPAAAPEVEPVADPAAEPEYSTEVRPWQPGRSNAWVDDLDLICKQEGVLVTGYAGKYPERTAAETARLWAPAETRGNGALPSQIIPISTIEWEERCQLRTVRRQVVRYDHFVAARFAPPDLGRIGREYSDWRLVEAPPQCHPIEVPQGARLQQRIEAEVYFTGNLGRRRLPGVFAL